LKHQPVGYCFLKEVEASKHHQALLENDSFFEQSRRKPRTTFMKGFTQSLLFQIVCCAVSFQWISIARYFRDVFTALLCSFQRGQWLHCFQEIELPMLGSRPKRSLVFERFAIVLVDFLTVKAC